MNENQKHINYTAADIKRYHSGKMTPEEMHALERAAMEDPFLEDALEGYQVTDGSAESDLSELRDRLEKRVARQKVVPFFKRNLTWKVAAAILIVGGLGWAATLLDFSRKQEVAQGKSKSPSESSPNKAAATADSTSTDTVQNQFLDSPINGENQEITVSSDKAGNNSISVPRKEIPEEKDRVTLQNNDASREVSINQPAAAPSTFLKAADSLTPPSKEFTRLKKNLPDNKDVQGLDQNSKSAGFARAKSEPYRSSDSERNFAKSRASALYNNQNLTNLFKGRVTDEQGNPLPYANVTNVEDHIGTYADVRGYFNLISSDTTLNVQVKSLGFENRNLRLSNQLALNNVVLKEDSAAYKNGIVISSRRANTVLNRDDQMKLEEPEPADGWYNYDSYLANNTKVPEQLETKPNRSGGEVQVSFEVDANGDPVNIRIEKSLCKECDAEAIRLIKEGPKWRRKAKKTGKRVTVTIPF